MAMDRKRLAQLDRAVRKAESDFWACHHARQEAADQPDTVLRHLADQSDRLQAAWDDLAIRRANVAAGLPEDDGIEKPPEAKAAQPSRAEILAEVDKRVAAFVTNFAAGLSAPIRDHVERKLAPALERIEELERQVQKLDGVGVELDVDYDGERSFSIRAKRGDQITVRQFQVPVILDRGVWKSGTRYEKGDAVTYGGSLWICQTPMMDQQPGTGEAWRLAVKKGRDAPK